MKEYKCIVCGHTKETEKDCSCSECRYKMFQTPFDRKVILIN
jgi:DNA-directed RNA polymerase subunit RPC12/RpoP